MEKKWRKTDKEHSCHSLWHWKVSACHLIHTTGSICTLLDTYCWRIGTVENRDAHGIGQGTWWKWHLIILYLLIDCFWKLCDCSLTHVNLSGFCSHEEEKLNVLCQSLGELDSSLFVVIFIVFFVLYRLTLFFHIVCFLYNSSAYLFYSFHKCACLH